MFKTRLITALVLLPAFLFLLFGLSPQGFSLVFALLILIGGWEYSRLCGLIKYPLRILYLLSLGLLLLYLATENNLSGISGLRYGVTLTATYLPYIAGLWGFALLRLIFWQQPTNLSTPMILSNLVNMLMSLLLLASAWYAISLLRFLDQGQWWVLALFFIVWAADVGAYLAGKQFGHTKLAPAISPGKTRAGLYGGMVLAVLVAWIFIQFTPITISNTFIYLTGALGISLISVVGDLYVSMHKRNTGIKDSGRLFPGHGGILDRLDSTIAAAPFYLALLYYLQ